ncbi:sulfurtransferase [Corynebacterium lubricantis]|uniref:sulfurtransferase n=1 Tax=Corynebacterium lubricantis TaxID=541095 RepID=UPI00037BABF7|nr:rhodanese-like domain-containing protein [Corynebacterium lubricantis]
MTVFISAHELADYIRHGQNQTVISTIWAPLEGEAHAIYQSNHIPTSLFCDPAYALAGIPSSLDGRNPMPSVGALQKSINAWGLKKGRPVVVFDPGTGVFAARAWWMLRWAGIEEVYILDGGRAEWDRQELPTVGGPGNISVGSDVVVQPNSLPTIDIHDVKRFEGTLLDARGESRFEGRREILDLKAGHIPGAVNLPVSELFDEHNRILPTDQVLARLAEEGIDHTTNPSDVVTYSGSGNHSAMLLAAMAHAGLPIVTHYVGGWSQWSANPANQVARHV